MQMPFGGSVTIDTFSTGTAAAAAGGTTTIIDFPVQQRGQELGETLEIWMGKLEENPPVIDIGFHMIVSDVGGDKLAVGRPSGPRGRDQLQVVHGLQGRRHGRRRIDFPDAAQGR